MQLVPCFIGYIVTRFTWLGVGETEPLSDWTKIATEPNFGIKLIAYSMINLRHFWG